MQAGAEQVLDGVTVLRGGEARQHRLGRQASGASPLSLSDSPPVPVGASPVEASVPAEAPVLLAAWSLVPGAVVVVARRCRAKISAPAIPSREPLPCWPDVLSRIAAGSRWPARADAAVLEDGGQEPGRAATRSAWAWRMPSCRVPRVTSPIRSVPSATRVGGDLGADPGQDHARAQEADGPGGADQRVGDERRRRRQRR